MTTFKLTVKIEKSTGRMNIVFYDEHQKLIGFNFKDGHYEMNPIWYKGRFKSCDKTDLKAIEYAKKYGLDSCELVNKLTKNMNAN